MSGAKVRSGQWGLMSMGLVVPGLDPKRLVGVHHPAFLFCVGGSWSGFFLCFHTGSFLCVGSAFVEIPTTLISYLHTPRPLLSLTPLFVVGVLSFHFDIFIVSLCFRWWLVGGGVGFLSLSGQVSPESKLEGS